jgi:hypothetical protein
MRKVRKEGNLYAMMTTQSKECPASIWTAGRPNQSIETSHQRCLPVLEVV